MSERDGRDDGQSAAEIAADTDTAEGIVNPEDLPAQIEVTERDGVTRIDIADDAATRPGGPDPDDGPA